MYTPREIMRFDDNEIKRLLSLRLYTDHEIELMDRATMIQTLTEKCFDEFFEESEDIWQVSFDNEVWFEVDAPYNQSKEVLFNYIQQGGIQHLFEQWLDESQTYFDDTSQVNFYIGRALPYEPAINATDVLESINATAWNQLGSRAEGYLINISEPAKTDLQNQLNAVLNNWLAKYHLNGTLQAFDNIQSFSLPYWTLKAQ